MAVAAMRRASASEQVRELIEARMKAKRNWASLVDDAERRGREQGLEQGREQGREEAREQARQRLLEAARQMRQAGVPIDTILQATGLTREDLGE